MIHRFHSRLLRHQIQSNSLYNPLSSLNRKARRSKIIIERRFHCHLVVTMQYRYGKQWWCKRIEKEREEQSRFHLKDRRERSFCERHAEDKRNELSLSDYRNDEVERERRKMDGPASTSPLREEREREVWEEWEVRRTLADNNKVLIKQLVKRGGLVNSRSWMEMAQGMKEARASLLPGYVPSFVFILLVSLFLIFFLCSLFLQLKYRVNDIEIFV